MTDGRTLACTRCRESVRVLELPGEFIEPGRYVCGTCLQPTDAQLELDPEPVIGERTETHTYDPQKAAIPF